MNVLELQREEREGVDGSRLRILVDGRDLVDWIRVAEQQSAATEGHPDLAGGYGGIAVASMPELRRHFLGMPDALYDHDGGTELLVCESCGEPGCWPFVVRITADETVVHWSDYRQPHRPHWTYEGLPEFRFDRARYEAAIAHVAGSADRSPAG